MRRRFPEFVFALLVLATIGAFLLVQALKTADPLVWFRPVPIPAVIDPIHGRVCLNNRGQPLNYRHTRITIEISHTDTVGVYIVNAANAAGPTVATVTSGTPMLGSVPGTKQWHPRTFTWNGRLAGGRPAPDGTYYFRIFLQKQGRTINLSDSPLQVMTQAPKAKVVAVSLLGQKGPTTGPVVLTPPHGELKISYTSGSHTPGGYRRVWVDVYRTDVQGPPQMVGPPIAARTTGTWARWNGEIGGQPAPAGTYLFGLTAQNMACDVSHWPARLPPAPGTTPHAGASIRYLTVTPPLTPTVSGSRAAVTVSSPAGLFRWKLRRTGTRRVLAHGVGPAGGGTVEVRMPRRRAGLYTLFVSSGSQSAEVPLVASKAGAAATRAPVLVVLPALTWMGNSPVDDNGSGFADTLNRGRAADLNRPLVDGPPSSLGSDAALLAYLDAQRLSYQLTTDVALAENTGPSLFGRSGVLIADGAQFVPSSLAAHLRGFVKGGGRALVLGAGSLRGVSRLSGWPSNPRASAPSLASTDIFGVRHGPITPTGGQLISELTDQLGLFASAPSFSGFSVYRPLTPPSSSALSASGIGNQSDAIVGFRYGSGIAVEVGLPQFGFALAHNIDAQGLIASVWQLLASQG